MDFELTPEQALLRESARRVLEKEIAPLVDELDRQGPLTRARIREFFGLLSPLGYLGHVVPERYGGAGMRYVEYGVLMEELWRAYPSLGIVVMIQGGAMRAIALWGSEEQKTRYLPPLISGNLIGCGAITEPDVGSNPAAVETTAQLTGANYVLSGTKTWISNGTVADLAVVVTRVVDAGGTFQGLGRLIVEKAVSPFTTREIPKMGLRSSPTAELHFDGCPVPAENLIGRPGMGLKMTLKGFEVGRCLLALAGVGIATAAIEAAVRYANSRTQFGRPIGKFQLIQAMLAEMVAERDAARLLAYRALQRLDQGGRAVTESSLAKFYATEAAVKVASKALQIHGAYGLSEEFALERYFRDARSLTIPDGTTEIQKLIVGRELLGLRAFE